MQRAEKLLCVKFTNIFLFLYRDTTYIWHKQFDINLGYLFIIYTPMFSHLHVNCWIIRLSGVDWFVYFLYFSYIHFRFEIDEYMAPKQFLRGLRPYKSYIFSSNVKQKKNKRRKRHNYCHCFTFTIRHNGNSTCLTNLLFLKNIIEPCNTESIYIKT